MSCKKADAPNDLYRVHTRRVSGHSICHNSLTVHLIQPVPSSRYQLLHDAPRPESIYILSEIINSSYACPCSELFVLPELCFGAMDFKIINALIQNIKKPVIVLAGFGYTNGRHLREIVANGFVTLESGFSYDDILEDKVYNGGWCWANDGKGNVSCSVYLKNFSGSTESEAINNLHRDTVFLRFETEDLVIFPLLCSDIFCEAHKQHSHFRVLQSLRDNPPAKHQKVIITGHIYSSHPEHEIWIDAIDKFSELDERPLILLSNQPECEAHGDKQCSAFNLTGVFTHPDQLDGEIEESTNISKFYTRATAGIVLMDKSAGATSGLVTWNEEGKVSIKMEHTYTWEDFQLVELRKDEVNDTW